jgi:ABC-type multidrug transport system ATPase subunit
VLISSHLVHELERICDWVGVLDHGRLVDELPMVEFKNAIKRIRVQNAPADVPVDVPFAVLDRRAANGVSPYETWVVRGWSRDHQHYLECVGATVRDVVDLDLEDGFVELLRAQRARRLDLAPEE